MASEFPTSNPFSDAEPAWKSDPQIRKNRAILVPDTIEWSGQRPWSAEYLNRPIEFRTPSGWKLRLACFDRPKGRVLNMSSCTGLETPIMPFGDHAWDFLETVEAGADEFLRSGWRLARADFARDMVVPDSVAYLRDAITRAVAGEFQLEAHRKSRQLGVTFLSVAGGDRLRIYHKGLEAMKKYQWRQMDPRLEDVIRVELQLRKGQLDARHQEGVSGLRHARVRTVPNEHTIPPMRLKPAHGRGIKRTHLHAMKRDRLPQRAVEATEAVDAFLLGLGLERLLPDSFGATMPEPVYGLTHQHDARK